MRNRAGLVVFAFAISLVFASASGLQHIHLDEDLSSACSVCAHTDTTAALESHSAAFEFTAGFAKYRSEHTSSIFVQRVSHFLSRAPPISPNA